MKYIKTYKTGWQNLSLTLIATLFILLLSQCKKQKDFEYIPGSPESKLGITTWQFIQKKDSLSLMEKAIIRTGLKNLYTNKGANTYILSLNAGFREYLSENNYPNISAVPVPILKYLLLYQVIGKKILTSDTGLVKVNPMPYETMNGQTMFISHSSRYQLVINEGTSKSWEIRVSNLEAKNGAIHISPEVVYFSAKNTELGPVKSHLNDDTLFALADTYVRGGWKYSGDNFSNEDLLEVKNVSAANYYYARKVYLMFDLNDFNVPGNLRKVKLQLGVDFSHGRGVDLSLYNVPNNSWSESSITWANAPAADPIPIAVITSHKSDLFEWDITDYISDKLQQDAGKFSILLNAEPESDEVDNFYSTRNSATPHPRIIITLSSGNSNLVMGTNNGLTVKKGGIGILNDNILTMEGAAHGEIIYTIVTPPIEGWLINGIKVLNQGDTFTQLDIDSHGIVYVHNDQSTSDDSMVLSVQDLDGGAIAPFTFNIAVE